jgi:hypothetical protein
MVKELTNIPHQRLYQKEDQQIDKGIAARCQSNYGRNTLEFIRLVESVQIPDLRGSAARQIGSNIKICYPGR